MEQQRHVPEARAKIFSCKTYSRLSASHTMSNTEPPPAPSRSGRSREAGFRQPASSNPATQPDSECEQPCPSCRYFLERSDFGLRRRSQKGTPSNNLYLGIACFPFAQIRFLRMTLIVSRAHLLVFSSF